MARQRKQSAREAKAPLQVRLGPTVERRKPQAERPDPAKPPARSEAMRLAAEVTRLERDLAIARARLTALEARVDIDPLTDVLNRRGFERELKRCIGYVKRYGTAAALIYLDLDGFKPVNDRHGHAAGDAVLKAVAAALIGHVRGSDVVGRLGGDEFVVLLWNAGEQQAGSKAQTLECTIGSLVAIHAGKTVSVGASAGVAAVRADDDPAGALERADAAMYARKAEKRALAVSA